MSDADILEAITTKAHTSHTKSIQPGDFINYISVGLHRVRRLVRA